MIDTVNMAKSLRESTAKVPNKQKEKQKQNVTEGILIWKEIKWCNANDLLHAQSS